MKSVTTSSILISLVCVVVVAVLVKVVNWIWIRPKKQEKWLKQQGIPGTSYRILFGDLKNLSHMRSQAMAKPITEFSDNYAIRIDPFRDQLITEFGKEFFTWFGPRPMMCIFKPELIREIFAKIEVFQKSKVNPMVDKFFAGLVNYEGEQWSQHRKMINPAFHTEKIKLMLPAFYESCNEMIDKWEILVAKEGSREVDVWPYLITLSADVISRAAFSTNYTEGQKIFQLLKEQIGLTVKILQSLYFPGLRYLPTARNRRFNAMTSEIETLLKGIIDKRKKAMGDGDKAKNDLLGILLHSNLKDIEQIDDGNKKQKIGISLQEVIDNCKLFYLAGQETTSILLVWTLIMLSKHQDWQARAREEVLETFGNDAPHFEGLSHLKIVTMILHEVLRMYPPGTNLIRMINKDTELGEFSLPAGAMLNIPVVYVHRDREIWGEDAEEFRPQRFSEGISKATRGKNAFFPFGGGPRICIGEKFAINEAKMALSMILQRFSLELSPSYVHAPMTIFFLQPQHGAQIIINKLR